MINHKYDEIITDRLIIRKAKLDDLDSIYNNIWSDESIASTMLWKVSKTRDEAMSTAIKETFLSVTGSSLTTMAGFLALCAMCLTLGRDLGIVMAKGVLLGVITVLTLFPSLLLVFDKLITKTKHKDLIPG